MILATALLLLAAAPVSAADLSWLIDDDIPSHVAAAEQDAAALASAAAQTDAIRAQVLQRREASLKEKATLEPTLATLSRGKRSDAEKRIAELVGIADAAAKRAGQLQADSIAQRREALAKRDLAVAMKREGDARRAEDAKRRLAEDADLATLPDVRLKDAIAYWQKRIARLPKQLAALDVLLESEGTTGSRGDVFARKEAARAAAAADEAEIARITEELRFRADSKSDETVTAGQLDDAAKIKAAELHASPTLVPAGPDTTDAMLDRVLASQDREAAERRSASTWWRTLGRWFLAFAGFGALAATLYFFLGRQA